jgi:hypothetical protein
LYCYKTLGSLGYLPAWVETRFRGRDTDATCRLRLYISTLFIAYFGSKIKSFCALLNTRINRYFAWFYVVPDKIKKQPGGSNSFNRAALCHSRYGATSLVPIATDQPNE